MFTLICLFISVYIMYKLFFFKKYHYNHFQTAHAPVHEAQFVLMFYIYLFLYLSLYLHISI